MNNDDLHSLFMIGYNNPNALVPKTTSQSKLMLIRLGQIFAETSKPPPQEIFRDGDEIVNISNNASTSYALVCLKSELVLIDNYGQIFYPKTSGHFDVQTTSSKITKAAVA